MLFSKVSTLVFGLLVSISTALPTEQHLIPRSRHESISSLADLALQKVLQDASPIFGNYVQNATSTSTWMKAYPDHTNLIQMNLPGTHDTQTWNYSLETQQSLKHVTDLTGATVFPPQFYRCQEQSIISMLNAGIRVFDLRFAFDPTNSTLVFWHSQALQSETATVDSVLYGFYKWLDDHPSEALLVSLNYESSTTIYAQNNADVQMAIFNTLTSAAANQYLMQTKNEFTTLGKARGKITLLRRFNLSQLPASYSDAIPGIYFPASQWKDNDPDITLVYNTSKNLTAYIEDYYEIQAPIGSGPAVNIQMKFNATSSHLLKAADKTYSNSLFWSFASSEHNVDIPSEYPRIMALGNDTTEGVNQKLLPYFQGMKGTGKRLGIVMFDFFGTPAGLVESFLAIDPV